MNTSRRDLYAEEGNEQVDKADDEAQAMLDRMLSTGWSNIVDTHAEEQKDVDMNLEEEQKPAEPAMHSFKLLSNAPVTKINVDDAADGSSASYDKSTEEHNKKQRKMRQSSPSSSDLDRRRSQFESIAVDFDWIKQQSSVNWKPLESPTKKTATKGPQPFSALAVAKTVIKDDTEEKDKQGLVHKPYVPLIGLAPPPQHNTLRKKAKKLRTPPAFFAATPDQCKYAASAAYFYGKPSSRPFNRPERCQRKYVRGDRKGITAYLDYKRNDEAERVAHKAHLAEEKAKTKNRRRVEGRGTGKGDTLGVSRVEVANKGAATGANAT